MLKGVSKTLLRTARQVDFVARYGGEEFAVILMGADRRDAAKTAERILKAVSRDNYHHEEKKEDLSITVSIGSTTFPADGTVKEELISRTDQALYLAKETGRNRHRSYHDIAR